MDYHEMSSSEAVNYRKSGLFLAGVVVVVYGLQLIRGKHELVLLILAGAVALAAMLDLWPLRRLVDAFIRFGNIMHRFTNPFLFGLIYILAVLPTSLALKLLGKDVLRLRYDRACPTYWVLRSSNFVLNESFRNQF